MVVLGGSPDQAAIVVVLGDNLIPRLPMLSVHMQVTTFEPTQLMHTHGRKPRDMARLYDGNQLSYPCMYACQYACMYMHVFIAW